MLYNNTLVVKCYQTVPTPVITPQVHLEAQWCLFRNFGWAVDVVVRPATTLHNQAQDVRGAQWCQMLISKQRPVV